MTASDDHGTASGTVRESTRALTRYDLVLAVIPLAFLLALGVAQVTAASARAALAAASAVNALAVADALFRNPPRYSGPAGGA